MAPNFPGVGWAVAFKKETKQASTRNRGRASNETEAGPLTQTTGFYQNRGRAKNRGRGQNSAAPRVRSELGSMTVWRRSS